MTRRGAYGSALAAIDERRIPLFWAKVRRDPDCWEWTAATDVGGYGVFQTGHRMSRAHRVSWIIANGPLPEGVLVLHRCDNRRCVRPDHLELGDQQRNVADMDRRGRRARGYRVSRRGERHQAAKLSDEQVAAVRVLRAAGWPQRRIGALLGLSHTYVGQLERGEMRSD